MRKIISGSFTGRGRLKRWNCTAWRMRLRAPANGGTAWSRRNAAFPRPLFWNSIRQGIFFSIGAARTGRDTSGLIPITASPWITKVMSGSAGTASELLREARLQEPGAVQVVARARPHEGPPELGPHLKDSQDRRLVIRTTA